MGQAREHRLLSMCARPCPALVCRFLWHTPLPLLPAAALASVRVIYAKDRVVLSKSRDLFERVHHLHDAGGQLRPRLVDQNPPISPICGSERMLDKKKCRTGGRSFGL